MYLLLKYECTCSAGLDNYLLNTSDQKLDSESGIEVSYIIYLIMDMLSQCALRNMYFGAFIAVHCG